MPSRRLTPLLIAVGIVVVFAVSLAARSRLMERARPARRVENAPRRIVSMAPNLTEILFTLGLGDRVVGVTRYCQRPPEAMKLPKVGGHLDPNFEAVVALRPDLVVLLREQAGLVESFEKLGVRTVAVADNSLDEVFEAIGRIGTACRVGRRATDVTARLRRRVEHIQQTTAGLPRPRVLLVIDRTHDTGGIEDAYVAGTDEYFEQLIRLAGGKNAYRGPRVAFPVVSAEGLMHMDPEVIVDFSAAVAAATGDDTGVEDRLDDWQSLPRLAAVRNERVYAVGGQGMLLPGPGMVDLLEALAERFHPSAGETVLSRARRHHW